MAINKIMVVNNVPAERQLLEEALISNGYGIIMLDNGEEAVAKSKELMPDLILMDVFMSGLNGFQASRIITHREETKHIPVIIFAVQGRETDKIWGLQQGAVDTINKPIKSTELIKKIRALDQPAQPSAQARSSTPTQPKAVSPAAMLIAEQQLARHMGPLSKILVNKAAHKANTLFEFHLTLADSIADEKKRREFLIELERQSHSE